MLQAWLQVHARVNVSSAMYRKYVYNCEEDSEYEIDSEIEGVIGSDKSSSDASDCEGENDASATIASVDGWKVVGEEDVRPKNILLQRMQGQKLIYHQTQTPSNIVVYFLTTIYWLRSSMKQTDMQMKKFQI